MTAPVATTPRSRCTWRVKGQVQGVGFRPFVYRLATELGLSGTVANDPSGVTIEAWGPTGDLDAFERRLPGEAPALARIDEMRRVASGPANRPEQGFRIIASDHAPAQRGRVTVDSGVCADCLRELRDAGDRRHRHALINCTNCGPRYTIVRDLPYDRPLTTMAAFPMCPVCAAEYADPGDRRFHAQPTCCPACGPALTLIDHDGRRCGDGDPTRAAAGLLHGGGVIAMKGLGGYHLVADATCETAVARLRRGKRRDAKPFALMAADVDGAGRLVRLSDDARALLDSPISPIVLAPRRDGAGTIAPSVAPGCHRLGVMVPHTPMQHLLMAEAPGPLIMTSANLSDDPLISDDEDARLRLGELCDALLTHDRPIERAVDDSIVIDGPRGILPLRRARGYVPTPLPLPVPAGRPGLCVGGELKGAVAVVRDGEAVLGQHLGDLTYALAYRRFERTIDDLLRLYDVTPQWIACDAHPQYLSHRYARRLADASSLDLIVVQHHHAHLASLLAEHGRTDRVIGLIADGVGYGDDGTAWGGEVLAGDLRGYRRVGRLRPLRLPGGDAAARETGRCALSWLVDALGPAGASRPLAEQAVPEADRRRAVLHMLQSGLNCPPSSGAGRLFDAAASLLGLCRFNHYEAMSGMALEAAAAEGPADLPGDGLVELVERDGNAVPIELDHRPLGRRLVELIEAGAATGSLAWLFHDAMADGMSRAARRAAEMTDTRTVGLSGGVFCNTLLTELVARRLEEAGLEVLTHCTVPPNDGGIACGQAAIAAASTATRET